MSHPSHAHDASMFNWTRSVAILAATFIGLGVIFLLAANWDTLSRMGQFGLLQVAMLVCALCTWWRPTWRVPTSLLLFLLTGGLLALIGQTYQTGADPWQLFALWSLLCLPLVWHARHDAVWAAWVVVAMTALSLWEAARATHAWQVSDQNASIHLGTWLLAWLIVVIVSPLARPWTGAGQWSHRLALTLTVILITVTAVINLFEEDRSWLYTAGLVTLTTAAIWMARRVHRDLYAFSVLLLSLNVMLVTGLAYLLLSNGSGDVVGTWILLTLLAAGLLSASVKLGLHLANEDGGAA